MQQSQHSAPSRQLYLSSPLFTMSFAVRSQHKICCCQATMIGAPKYKRPKKLLIHSDTQQCTFESGVGLTGRRCRCSCQGQVTHHNILTAVTAGIQNDATVIIFSQLTLVQVLSVHSHCCACVALQMLVMWCRQSPWEVNQSTGGKHKRRLRRWRRQGWAWLGTAWQRFVMVVNLPTAAALAGQSQHHLLETSILLQIYHFICAH